MAQCGAIFAPHQFDLQDGETTDDLCACLTCKPNAEVAELNPKAMPVMLTEAGEWETWLTAPWAAATALQRPLPDGARSIEIGFQSGVGLPVFG